MGDTVVQWLALLLYSKKTPSLNYGFGAKDPLTMYAEALIRNKSSAKEDALSKSKVASIRCCYM